MAQRWEYMALELQCQRGPLGGIMHWYWQDIPDTRYSVEGRLSALDRLQMLGEEGWELVSVTPLSLDYGAGGLAGLTSTIEYAFKRTY